MNHTKLYKTIVLTEILGFFLIISLTWVNEFFDLPHLLFNQPQTPFNFSESIIESILIFLLASIVIGISIYLLNKIDSLALYDSLTEALNRRFMIEIIKDGINRSIRSKKPFSLIAGDIDNFKRINDTYGHECGDIVLSETIAYLRNSLREQDLIGRFGGDEFVIYLPETSLNNSKKVAETLCQGLSEKEFNYKMEKLKTTISFGVIEYDLKGKSPFPYLKQADVKLYKAKKQGRNIVIA